MEVELFSLRRNHTWSLVPKPRINKLIQTKWIKPRGDNKSRYKAWMVAKVFPAHRFKYWLDELKVDSG